MFINNKIVAILILILFIITSMQIPDAYANGAPNTNSSDSSDRNIPGEIIVIGALAIPCIGLGMWFFPKKSKKKNV